MRVSNKIKQVIRRVLDIPFFIVALILIPANILVYQLKRIVSRTKHKPRLIFGSTPIISLSYIARSLKDKGYISEVAVCGESSIYANSTFDHILLPKRALPKPLKLILGNAYAYWFFLKSIWKYDVFHYYFDGGFLRHTLFDKLELSLLKLCGKKIVLLPYGSDAFVYDLIPYPMWRHGLLIDYAQFGNQAASYQKKIRSMTAKADVVIACLVHYINLPRWDLLPLTCYPVDTDKCKANYSKKPHSKRPVRIAHACNHRGIKGTVFLIHAVENLKKEGFEIELDIIERVSNEDALNRISECDLYVDQLIFGYAQAALEALAFGKVVISAIDHSEAYQIFRQFSYLNECPILPANTETIQSVLSNILNQSDYWEKIGRRSRAFAEKRHSFAACAKMYEAIYDKIWWQREGVDLINLYHPLLEEQNESTPSSI